MHSRPFAKNAFLLCVVLALCVTSCGTPSSPQESPLQQLNTLEPAFKRLDRLSGSLSADLGRLNVFLHAESMSGIRGEAGHMTGDARLLEHTTGQASGALEAISRQTSSKQVKHYVTLEDRSLTAQWWEAFQLVKLSRVLQKDPLATVPGNARLVGRLSWEAQRSADAARSWAKAGAAWRALYSGEFRYIAVSTATKK